MIGYSVPDEHSSVPCPVFVEAGSAGAPAEVDIGTSMNRDRAHFLFLNIGHFLDHLFTLIFALHWKG